MGEKFLDRVYNARTADETRALYDDWSASYDAEVTENGYATPDRCAVALRAQIADPARPVLDFGCGTGLSGMALRRAGFTTLDGVDLSAEMLEGARAKGIYRSLSQIAPGAALDHVPGEYAAIAAIGVIGAGAAPISTFDVLMNGLARGGFLVLSFNDHALKDPANEGRVNEWLDCGAARLVFREHGPHLPARNITSTVYVIEKL
jgi:predicted TPR repeat methyltransferase